MNSILCIMSDTKRHEYDACFNPFNERNHKYKKRKSLRRVTNAMLVKLKLENIVLSSQLKVCDTCRAKISKLPNPEHVTSELCVPGNSSQNLPEPKSHESSESSDANSSASCCDTATFTGFSSATYNILSTAHSQQFSSPLLLQQSATHCCVNI